MSANDWEPLLATPETDKRPSAARTVETSVSAAVVGVLIGFKDEGRTPLVAFPGQPGNAAMAARSTVDVHTVHIGRQTVLLFEGGDLQRPIITGLLRQLEGLPSNDQPGQVQVDLDGERLIITAQRQLVLQCGKSSITLTHDGKVLIQGTYLSSRSSGVNRIKGGSVQLN